MSGQSERRAFLSLGGNLGEPERSMATALRMLDADPQTRVGKVSSLYRTPPWGKLDQPDFLNVAAEIHTRRDPHGLLDLCLGAEKALKRVREERWGPRIVDIDVLTFDDLAVHEAGLEVPHPRMLDRAFVLIPLAEIAPDLVVSGKTVAERAAAIDASGIERLASGQDWWRR
ncbi:MAG: 2-amino-4-hydroxy-6-hydroxymethyldihydropteridine diphosphokinase [Rhizobiaceae bacterium]|nr:MAG: 2-amino-4-hydroxy-6-hydroxymethyldihydropteridine diphosphokinase [Rhizobiaceae bacterium]CAG1004087.1 2-amino-4-hydroxy-6-hydroxymethyldihydropteridinediphosphokinase [Rhizobiaceae bacterium]